MVFFRLAAAAAFLIFFRAAWDCLEEGMNQPYRSSATIGIGQFS